MGLTIRPYVYVALLASLVAALVVVGTRGGASSTGEALPAVAPVKPGAAPGVGRIAYVAPDHQIWTARPDGSDAQRVTPEEGRFTWPTWSPDGRRLAFSGVMDDGKGNQTVTLFATDALTGTMRAVHTREPGVRTIVADDAPHYLLWSPDASRLAFLAGTSAGLSLYIEDFRNDEGPAPVIDRAPIYFGWSPSSRYVLLHRGASHLLVDTRKGNEIRDLGISAPDYRAPSWWPRAEWMTFLAPDGGPGSYSLYMREVEGGEQTEIERELEFSVFLWSPPGRYLAVARSLVPGSSILKELRLFSPDGSRAAPSLVAEEIVAFFWSPDGSKIAYAVPTENFPVLRWNIMDVASGSRWPLVEFIPSKETVVVLQFFDQYAASHQLWSPDSSALVFAGTLFKGLVSASVGNQSSSGVIVVETELGSSARVIGAGLLAFWSPR